MKNSNNRFENLRAVVDAYYKSQKSRVAWENRLRALRQEKDTEESPRLLQAQSYLEMFGTIEKRAFGEMGQELISHPAWPWLRRVKGIGPTLAAKLLCDIDIELARHVSSLWKFCGLAPKNGRAMRKVKGEKLQYNQKLRNVCYLIGTQFLMTKRLSRPSPYLAIYDRWKIYYHENRKGEAWQKSSGEEDWRPLRIDLAARRKMVNIFLSHLWLTWREAVQLPTSKPYAIGVLGHETYYEPWDFVEKEDTKGDDRAQPQPI
jgi:hypothetical protein